MSTAATKTVILNTYDVQWTIEGSTKIVAETAEQAVDIFGLMPPRAYAEKDYADIVPGDVAAVDGPSLTVEE